MLIHLLLVMRTIVQILYTIALRPLKYIIKLTVKAYYVLSAW